MEKRWKRLGAGLLATILLVAAVLQWRTHRESVAKVALAAEIRAERAARPAPPEPLPTREEEETATLYREAVSLLTVDEYLSLEFEGVGEAMDSPPWDAVPGSIKEILAANVGALTLADAAEARGVCRFSDSSLQARVSACTMLLRLVSARGHVALAEGDPLAAAKEVRRLLGLGRDLAAASVIVGSEVVFPWPDMHLLRAEAAAAELLAALATAPDLPPEVGPAIAAAARAPWDSAHANRRALEVNEASSDALLLALLSPGAEAWLEERNRQWMEIEAMLRLDPPIHGFLPRAWDRIGRFLSPSPSVPRAEEMRFFRDLRTSIVGALRRRDMVALAPDGPHEEAGPLFGFLGPA